MEEKAIHALPEEQLLDEWREENFEGNLMWVNDARGMIMKVGNGAYVASVARMVKLGPFETQEQAKQIVEENHNGFEKNPLNECLELFNLSLLELMKQVKNG